MTSAVQCIVILASTAIITSSETKVICCLRGHNTVRVPLRDIVNVTEYPPGPYCNRKEVIITLKNGRLMSLNPNGRYAKLALKWVKALEAAKTTTATTTTAPQTQTVSVMAKVKQHHNTILKCRCLNSGKGRVPLDDIVGVTVYPPRPYCNKKEVIIALKNGRHVCIHPHGRHTKEALKWVKAREAAKNTIATTTTAPETV